MGIVPAKVVIVLATLFNTVVRVNHDAQVPVARTILGDGPVHRQVRLGIKGLAGADWHTQGAGRVNLLPATAITRALFHLEVDHEAR